MNPRAEAQAKVGDAYDARVLEPSPPAVNEPPWFADDPVARDGATRPVVSPVSSGDVLWSELAAEAPQLADWCRERWLGPYPPLAALPARLRDDAPRAARASPSRSSRPRANAPTARSACASCAAASARRSSATTRRCRSRGRRCASCAATACETSPLTSLAAAAAALGDLADPDRELDDEPLDLDEGAARVLGDWFGFCYSVLEELRARADDALDASRVQLWPEHFDMAVELGDDAAGKRAHYGCSPGDGHHPEPYFYVAAVNPPPSRRAVAGDGLRRRRAAVCRPARGRRPARARARVPGCPAGRAASDPVLHAGAGGRTLPAA